jgi:hypothetical protein
MFITLKLKKEFGAMSPQQVENLKKDFLGALNGRAPEKEVLEEIVPGLINKHCKETYNEKEIIKLLNSTLGKMAVKELLEY